MAASTSPCSARTLGGVGEMLARARRGRGSAPPGLMSRKAYVSSLEATSSAGTSPATILQNRQSDGLAAFGGRRHLSDRTGSG